MKSDKTTPNVPTLRFHNYNGEWQKTVMGKVCSFRKGYGIAKDDLSSDGTPCILYGELYTTYKTAIAKTIKSKTSLQSKSLVYSQKDDVIIPCSGETAEDIATSICVPYDGILLGGDLTIVHSDLDGAFLSNQINSVRKYDIARIAQGKSIVHLQADELEKIFIFYPSIQEQRKISAFIDKIDERIEIQNKIIEDLKVLKKELCKVILNNKGWPKFRIRDIANLGRGRVINTDEINSQHSPLYPVYSSQTSNNGIMGYLDQYDFEGEYITWTTDGANAGTVFYRNGRFNCTNVCGTLKLTVDFDYYITALSIQMVTEKYVSKNLANPKLMNNVMAEIEIFMPDFQTQKSLSSLFMSLDKKIESAGELLSCFVSEKKFLLNAMFI